MNAPITTPVAAKAASEIRNPTSLLFHDAWRRALAEYEAATTRSSAVANVRDRVDKARSSGALNDEAHVEILECVDAADDLCSDHKAILTLINTPAPDWDAYRTKAEIAIREGYAEEVATALLADANALLAQGISIGWSTALAGFTDAKREYDAYYAGTFGPALDAQKAFEDSKGFEHDPSNPAALATYSDRLNAFQEAHGTAHLVPEQVHKENERLCEAMCDAASKVLDTPAPDLSALRWKLEYLTDGLTRWDGWEGMEQVLADIAHLLPGPLGGA
ncbi:hypothetical protein [Pelagerythrobacter aerophilus]